MGVRNKTPKNETETAPESPAAAGAEAAAAADEANAAANAETVQTEPEAAPPTTPTDPDEAQALAEATAKDVADATSQPVPPPSDMEAGKEPDPGIVGPAGDHEVGEPELEDRDHAKGCPAERLEAYPATAPNGTKLKVSHCIDCGATSSTEV